MKKLLLWISLTACVPVSSMSGTRTTTGPDANGNVTIPTVFGMREAEAITELRRAGVQGEVGQDSSLCGSVVRGRIVEVGEVCDQHPAAGAVQGPRLVVTLRVQRENPWHGNAGKITEWHLMPMIVGMPVEQARGELRRVGFGRDDRVFLHWVDEPGCRPLTVCRTYPAPLERAGANSDKLVYAGRDATAKPPDPTPAPDPARLDAPKPDAPKPDGSKPEPAPEPFF
ncbi:MAG: hypothetical protein WKG01_16075 [Kofleriaceae bacterium]